MPTLTDLKVDWVSLVDRAAVRDPVQQSEPARFLLWKRDHPTPDEGDRMTPEEKAALEKAQADLTAALATIETQKTENATLTARVAEIEKAAEPVTKDDKVDLSKADPATRAYIEKMEAEREVERAATKKAQDEATEAHTLAKAERDARVTREFVTKAEGYKALVVKADDFGPVLKEASEKLSKAAYDELTRVLKAADEALASTDLFKEQGRAREGQKAGSAYAEAVQKAEKLRETDPKLTKQQAIDKAFDDDRDLRDRHIAETR